MRSMILSSSQARGVYLKEGCLELVEASEREQYDAVRDAESPWRLYRRSRLEHYPPKVVSKVHRTAAG
jgi:hypothetical protein